MGDEVLAATCILIAPGQIVEVRAITDDGIASGYFDSPEDLAEKVGALDVLPSVQGIYITLNPVNPALLSRRANRIKIRLGKKDVTTSDADIVRRRWLPVDVDPVRPSGVSSTGTEHAAAIAKARRIAEYLTGMGWPAPVLADSGNGAHLLYLIDLSNDDRSRDLVKHCLEVLASVFNDAVAQVDVANFNAARIWKLYGTMSRKGDSTADRPHRRAAIIEAPEAPEIVEQTLLVRLAGVLPEPPAAPAPARPAGKAGNPPARAPLDLRRWLSDHHIAVQTEKPYQGGTLFLFDQCPFSGAHKDGAYAIQFANGAIHAGCHHESCGGGSQRWQELRERFEPGKKRAAPKPESPPPGIPPGPAPGPGDTFTEEALLVLRSGDPLRAMLRTFALDHEGDDTVAECLIMSLASRSVLNTTGLHVSVSGESGKGKSHTFSTLIRQVPERHQLSGSMSNKALFYIDNLQPGTVIVLDDTSLSDDMSEILKGVTTSFRKPFMYRTVNKDRKGFVCTIPERCVWWVAKVEGSGDDQVFNRMLTCWIDDTIEQDNRVLTRILEDSEALPEHAEGERPDVQLCRAMWELLGRERLHVVIPFAKRIRFQSQTNRRNPEMLLGLVKAHTLLFSLQRERREVNGVPCIMATRADFDGAARLYSLLNGSVGGQTTKLTKMESDLINSIVTLHWVEFTIPMLQKATALSNAVLHRLIHGYTSRGAAYTGLLEKCPAIAYTDRTIISEDEMTGHSTRRRTNAYTFDHDLYGKWMAGGAVWLDDDPGPDPDEPVESRQSGSRITEGSVRQKAADSGGELDVLCTNTHLAVQNGKSGGTADHTNDNASAEQSASTYDGDSGTSVRSDPDSAPAPLNCEPDDRSSPIASRKPVPASAGKENKPAAGKITERRSVRASDYKKLEIYEGRSICYCCGRKGALYVEKLTAERKARPKAERDARCLCKVCYLAAAEKQRAGAPPLPGTIALAAMERISSSVGRCSVCDLAPAVYLDRGTGVRLCEACYSREAMEQTQKKRVGEKP
ncbi:hypothetical protein [Methanoregula formicica]|uniref:Uncharacterized protein n=1 Tax=Methanoregula formicica (strain DSM 22288 / NBRC 105244 / SMSP) TaxID=593750 RepID=L0HFF8_METFS|nr:hypothetical protein [Methanoregula formicica]AGB03477.1 hypothetical protein Metfor_2482 [Methanoregula formicica SMSP]